jgi:CheY-like chemotaxis protein
MPEKIKMLIVEDNEDERLFIKEGFLQSGLYEIVGEAEDGNEMLHLLDDSSFPDPDVILTDLNMPGKNGYEVITEIKNNTALSHIPVAVLTTAPLVPFAERCKKLGACAYFTKPDTFLDYKDFAEKIYGDLKKCLDNIRLNFSSIKKLKRNSNRKSLETPLSVALHFYNSIRMMIYGKQQPLTWQSQVLIANWFSL